MTLRNEVFDSAKGEKNEKVLFCVGKADLAQNEHRFFRWCQKFRFVAKKLFVIEALTSDDRLKKSIEALGSKNFDEELPIWWSRKSRSDGLRT